MLGYNRQPTGSLYVTIVEARNLHQEDILSQNDPYVELWINEKYKQSTTVIKNSNNPVWNQRFIFNLPQGHHNKLHFKIFDKDKIGSSDKIGNEVKLNFQNVYYQPIDAWLKIPGTFGIRSHGDLHVYLEFQPIMYM